MINLKVLVTGASGLLGSKLTELLVNKGYKVYSGYYTHRPKYGIPVKLDISNENTVSKIIDKVKPDIIMHSAALTDVDKCESDKDLAFKINVLGTKNIALYFKKYGYFLIYISTDYIFGGEKGLYSEDDVPKPVNYYGFTKFKGEEEIKKLLDEYCIVRSSVIYGSNPATGKVNFVHWIIEKLRNNEVVNAVVDQWNSPTLNTNLAEMIIEVVERRLTGIYHLAGATRINRYELAKLIAETFNLDETLIKPINLDEIPWVAKRPRDSSLNIRKARSILSNKPYTVREALKILKKELELIHK